MRKIYTVSKKEKSRSEFGRAHLKVRVTFKCLFHALTLKVVDLLPAFIELFRAESHKTFIIDEVDRSLHTLLTTELTNRYLSTCGSETRKQLIITTHDALLMDQEVMRRDEMWVTERKDGVSKLTPFSEFKDIRYDKDIRKSYLQGRMGGVPDIKLNGMLVKKAES